MSESSVGHSAQIPSLLFWDSIIHSDTSGFHGHEPIYEIQISSSVRSSMLCDGDTVRGVVERKYKSVSRVSVYAMKTSYCFHCDRRSHDQG
jgi:hypothetical protein